MVILDGHRLLLDRLVELVEVNDDALISSAIAIDKIQCLDATLDDVIGDLTTRVLKSPN
jgi:hypothetical protein